jgi:hypothetical protein
MRQKTEQPDASARLEFNWRHLLMALIVFGSFALIFFFQPLVQNPEYHNFADRRAFFGVPNFFDVASNLAFLVVGIIGLKICLTNHLGNLRAAWIILFAGVGLVSIGSAFYHWNPNNQTLVWDRLPMTIGFMGLFAALLGEYIGERLGRILLLPMIFLGFSSVIYWHWFDDLRFYIWIQVIPLLTIPVVMLLYRAKYSHQGLLLAALGLYVLAKLAELGDKAIFGLSQNLLSGHTIKHLLSALGCLAIVLMIQKRKPLVL